MNRQKYPNFRAKFVKGIPVDEVETVSLTDLGLPVDVPSYDEKKYADNSILYDIYEITSGSELFRNINAEKHYIRLLLSLNDREAAFKQMLDDCKYLGLSHYQLTIYLASKDLLDLTPGDAYSLVDEFVFIIETLIPRSIQDLFYFLALDTRLLYWVFFDLAAEKLNLERYTNINQKNYNQFKSHMQEGVKLFILNGHSPLKIYENTCATKQIIKEVCNSLCFMSFEGLKKSFGEFVIELSFFIRNEKYQKDVCFDDFQRITKREFNECYDFVLYKNEEPVLVIEYDGQEHYNCPSEFKELMETFEQQLHSDLAKIKYCIIKELPLLRVNYVEFDEEELRQTLYLLTEALLDPKSIKSHTELMELMTMLAELNNKAVNNREAIEKSRLCGCCTCRGIFLSSKISTWDGASALCPRCGEKSVIADAQGYLITDSFMSVAYHNWV